MEKIERLLYLLHSFELFQRYRSIRDQIIKHSKRAGAKYIQPKGLKHSHASLLINEYNVNALYIQRRLGHYQVILSTKSIWLPN